MKKTCLFQGIKCGIEEELNYEEYEHIVNMCLGNSSKLDSPSMNNNRDYNNGRHDGNRHHSNRNSYDGNMDSRSDGTYSRHDGNYDRYSGDRGNSYGLWRREQDSGGKVMMHEALSSIKYFARAWCKIQYTHVCSIFF